MEVDEHTLLSLQRKVERLRAEVDMLKESERVRASNERRNGGEVQSALDGSEYQQQHDVFLGGGGGGSVKGNAYGSVECEGDLEVVSVSTTGNETNVEAKTNEDGTIELRAYYI